MPEPRPVAPGTDEPAPDILVHGADRAPRRPLLLIVAALVGLAVAAGYARTHQGGQPAPAPSTAAPAGPALAGTGATCARQVGSQLVLGTQVVNRSSGMVQLVRAGAGLPMPGLSARETSWLPCEEYTGDSAASALALAPGTTTWLSIAFDVLVDCPAPLPVLFSVHYLRDGQDSLADVGGFNDLGEVPYGGGVCPTG
jgi:hypothetical protein